MQSVKKKISNLASAAKEHLTICKAKVDEKVEKAAARTGEQREIARERRKAKEAQAKMQLHQAKAMHAADMLKHNQHHQHRRPTMVGTQYGPTEPAVRTHANQLMAGTTVPAYPLGGHPPGPGSEYI